MQHKVNSITIFSVMLVAACISAASPKKGTATLAGVVLGPDDKPVAHASITYQSSGGSAPHATYTDARGRFAIAKLRSDNYQVRASANGVFSEWEQNVVVHSGRTTAITLHLIYAKEMPKDKAAKPKS